jgi:hypothetical protein
MLILSPSIAASPSFPFGVNSSITCGSNSERCFAASSFDMLAFAAIFWIFSDPSAATTGNETAGENGYGKSQSCYHGNFPFHGCLLK